MALTGFYSWLTRTLFGFDLPTGWAWFLSQATMVVVLFVVILVMLAFLLLFDRKVWAAVQMRRGPNVVGPFGLLQSFADFFKFMFKEPIIPAMANKWLYLFAPFLSFVLAMAAWAVVPVADGWVFADIDVGVLYLLAISSLGVYATIIAGWAANSKYSFLSGLRAAAQMVSYEVSIGFVIVTVILFSGSMNLSDIVRAQSHGWFICSLLAPMAVIYFISLLAETQRPPFDLLEAESELVAGFMVEYSSTPYLLFMIAEYVNIVMLCTVMAILFLGGWLPPLSIWPFTLVPGVFWLLAKVVFLFFLVAIVKAMVPRYRYDQLMRLGWKVFLPVSLVWVVLAAAWTLIFKA